MKSSGGHIKKNMSNKELTEELHKPITGKFEKKRIFIFLKTYLGC